MNLKLISNGDKTVGETDLVIEINNLPIEHFDWPNYQRTNFGRLLAQFFSYELDQPFYPEWEDECSDCGRFGGRHANHCLTLIDKVDPELYIKDAVAREEQEKVW